MKRSKWKGPFLKKKDITKRVITLSRNHEIMSPIAGLVCAVHSGRKLIKISLTNEMSGHKIGEFVPTRERFEFKKKRRK